MFRRDDGGVQPATLPAGVRLPKSSNGSLAARAKGDELAPKLGSVGAAIVPTVAEEGLRRIKNVVAFGCSTSGARQSRTQPKAIRYAICHWPGLCAFLDDGRIEMDTNVVERATRPIIFNRENTLFSGSDSGARH
jgi:hypothetical protein